MKTIRERDIEKRLVQRVKELGGEIRKVEWVGRRGAPDRLCMLPWQHLYNGVDDWYDLPPRTIWIELKAPGVPPEDYQVREHNRMRKLGQRVEVVDSYERIEEVLS